MNIPELVTLHRISQLERALQKLTKRVETIEHKRTRGTSSSKDADILATQAFLMAYYQLATWSSNPGELWDGFKHILEEQGLSQETLHTIEQWTTKSCETIDRSGFPKLPNSSK